MITGASGKDKDALVQEIKDVFGIVEEEQVSPYKKQIAEIKKQIKLCVLKKKAWKSAQNASTSAVKSNKLKKRTRKLAKGS